MARVRSTSMEQEDRQTRFDRLAPQLGFTLQHDAFEVGEHTDIGLFAGPLASSVMNYAVTPEPVSQDDDSAIEDIIRGWESLEPTNYKVAFSQFATDPYLLIGAESVGQVESGALETNTAFEEVLRRYPVYSPRRTTISNVQIVHVGGRRAAATYTVDEEYTNGSAFHGNAVAVLAKLDAGWRIVIATDHLTS